MIANDVHPHSSIDAIRVSGTDCLIILHVDLFQEAT